MSGEVWTLVKAIDDIVSVEEADSLSRLQDLADRYFALREAAEHMDVWFRLYERFPEEDANGVFWSILHGVEALPGSDTAVVVSVRRRPGTFPVRMVNRMLNAGIASVGGVDLLALLRDVAEGAGLDSVRTDAARYLAYQGRRA